MKSGSKPGFRQVVFRELNRILSDRTYLFIGLIAPVIGFGLIAWIFSASVPRKLPVAIVDRDHSTLSRQVVRTVDASPVAFPVKGFTGLTDAYQELVAGNVDAIVYIPEHTQRNLLQGKGASLPVYINNAYLIKAGVLQSGLQKSLATLAAGIKLRSLMLSGENQRQAMAVIQPVRLRSTLLFNPFTSYEYYLTLLLLPVMLTLFTFFGTIYAVGSELQYGTGPEWFAASGDALWPGILGKLVPFTVLFYAQAMAMNLIFFKILGLPLHGHLVIILVAELILVLAYQFMAVFFVAIMKNLRLALSIASAYTMLAITYAGMTFPTFGMPWLAKVFSSIFPFSYWIDLFAGQTLRGEPAVYALIRMLFMALFILAGALCAPRLRHLSTTSKYWGKI